MHTSTSGTSTSATPTIDLNSDLGESFGAWTIGNDSAVLDLVTSANIACGFHAGDPLVMIRTCDLAQKRGVRIGAHVGYRDLAGFGRRNMDYHPDDLRAETIYQIGALQAAARSVGAQVTYVKPHGALYNRIAHDKTQAMAVIEGILAADSTLKLMGLAGSPILDWASAEGLSTLAEAFADRAYNADGTLVSRSQPGAVHHDPDVVAGQAIAFATGAPITSIDGQELIVQADSLCVHGDNPEAISLSRRIIEQLGHVGVAVQAQP